MAKIFIQILVLFLSISSFYCPDPNVIQLTDVNFQKKLSLNQYILVMFYIPWSGTCQKFRRHFLKAARILKHNEIPVALGKMDCSGAGRRTCEKLNLGLHFPVFHFYNKSNLVKHYKGSRDSLSIIKFVRAQVLPGVPELKSVDEFKEFLKNQHDSVVIGFFDEETKLKRVFFKVADQMKETIIFAYTGCEKLMRRQGIMDGIALFRPPKLVNRYQSEKELFTGRVVIGEIKNFIIKQYHGLVGHRNPVNRYDFQNPLVTLYYTVDHNSYGKEINYWRHRMLKVAHKYKESVNFAICAKDDFEEELIDFKVDYTSPMRPFVLAKDLENNKYVMTENFSSEAFDRFVGQFASHELKPWVKSKVVPLESEGAVVISVANNFEETVIKNKKDILLALYAPCRNERCRKFAPLMREIADLLKDEDIAIVKYDITENEIPEMFKKRSIPNVYWIPKKKKNNPVVYDGGRSVDDVIKFLAASATKEMKRYTRSGHTKRIKVEL